MPPVGTAVALPSVPPLHVASVAVAATESGVSVVTKV